MVTVATPLEPQPYCLFDTAIGVCGIAWSARGLTRLQLPEANGEATERRLTATMARSGVADPSPEIQPVIDELRRYFAGERVDFQSVALDLALVSAFHRKVYDATRAVAWGQTTTYGALAAQTGSPDAARGVGQALGRNPIAVIIPCHRVLASGQKSGGFSAFGGVKAKARLLALEGVDLYGPRDGQLQLPLE